MDIMTPQERYEEEKTMTIAERAKEKGITDPKEIEIFRKGWLCNTEKRWRDYEFRAKASANMFYREYEESREKCRTANSELNALQLEIAKIKAEIPQTKYKWRFAEYADDFPTDDIFVLRDGGKYYIVRPQKFANQLYYESYNFFTDKWEFFRLYVGAEYLIIEQAEHPKAPSRHVKIAKLDF